MRALTAVELRLFVREPVTVIFALAMPPLFLWVLNGVFGNTPEPEVFRGVGAADYYLPAYVALVLAALGLLSVPVHLASYRERGVLRRFHASALGPATLGASQVAVMFVIAVAGTLLLVAVSRLGYDTAMPASWPGVLGGFLLGGVAFAALGILLGAVLPTARAAQGAGLILFFVMMFLSGAGPPPEVLPDAMGTVSDLLPLTYVIELLQGPWLGFGWDGDAALVVAGILVVAVVLALRWFRWDR